MAGLPISFRSNNVAAGNVMKKIYILLLLVLALQRVSAEQFGPAMLFISGQGKIFLVQPGQEVQVGRDYLVAAIPAPGYKFAGWQKEVVSMDIPQYWEPGHFFNLFDIYYSLQPGGPIVDSVFLEYRPEPVYLIGEPDFYLITHGWQAMFVPIKQSKP
jgi:hypothetical protein